MNKRQLTEQQRRDWLIAANKIRAQTFDPEDDGAYLLDLCANHNGYIHSHLFNRADEQEAMGQSAEPLAVDQGRLEARTLK